MSRLDDIQYIIKRTLSLASIRHYMDTESKNNMVLCIVNVYRIRKKLCFNFFFSLDFVSTIYCGFIRKHRKKIGYHYS